MVSAGGAFTEEAAHRASAARRAAAALSHRVSANARLPKRLRVLIAGACVHNRLLFAAGTWGLRNATAARRLAVPFLGDLQTPLVGMSVCVSRPKGDLNK